MIYRNVRAFLPLLAFVAATAQTLNLRIKAETNDELQEFYIVCMAVSDAAPFWFDYILDVRPQGSDVLVRFIRISPANAYCPDNVTVKAAQRVIHHSNARKVAGKANPCSFEEKVLASTMARFKTRSVASVDDSQRFGIVAQCGKSERLFTFPFPEFYDVEGIRKNVPGIIALWDLYYDVVKKAFGSKSVFYEISPVEDTELQKLGETFVPELRSGAFDHGFWDKPCWGPGSDCQFDSVSSLLEQYRGPIPQSDPHMVELQDGAALHLLQYVPPRYPPIAKQAHLYGTVQLRITPDPQTGKVVQVVALSGNRLLQEAALEAARGWKFDPALVTGAPIEAVINFVIRCAPN